MRVGRIEALLVGLGVGLLARGLFARRGGGGELLRAEDDEGGAPAPVPDEERETCNSSFLFHRQTTDFYRDTTNRRVNEVRACDAPAALEVPERISIPIYWVVVGAQWTADSARGKIQEATRWFEGYCIFLTVQPVGLRPFEAAAIQARLRRRDTGDPDELAEECKKVYKDLWQRIGRPKDLLVFLFLDAFQAVRYGDRVDRVAGNFKDFPLILVPGEPDTRSTHIVTHELIHGLGKLRRPASEPPTTSVPGSGNDRINTWDEGPCTNEMGNANRQNPGAPMLKNDSDLLDWASYHQFLARAKTIV